MIAEQQGNALSILFILLDFEEKKNKPKRKQKTTEFIKRPG